VRVARFEWPVRIAGEPAPEGLLSLGIATKSAPGWSDTAWTDLEVDRGGTARLPDLKPGTYRFLRIYQPRRRVTLPGAGWWHDGEVEVTVTGEETEAPPLAWAVEPPGPPVAAPVRKPAPRRER